MKARTLLLSLATLVASSSAEEMLSKISWTSLTAEGKVKVGKVIAPDQQTTWERLRIENAENQPLTVPLVALENLRIAEATFAVRGQVRCEEVEGDAYLLMWSHFADGQKFYSKTTESSGPMRMLTGTSGWRWFVLPFTVTQREDRPTKLEIGLVLPGRGTVEVGPLSLVQYAQGEDPMRVPGQWWSDRQAGLIGGIGGALLGTLGALIGILGGTGRAKSLALGLLLGLVVLGIACLGVGVVALVLGQPHAVYYPLLLGGGIAAGVSLGVLPATRRRYEALELRKMAAKDIAQG